MKGIVSTGHPLTTDAAIRMLKMGGNAFDAIVSAGFASTVTEPILTSLGGGGFLLGHDASVQKDFFYDFFVNTPGLGAKFDQTPMLIPKQVHFTETTQVFHMGVASIAVPGVLHGLIHCYKNKCSLDIEDIISPTIEYLENGIELLPSQKYFFNVSLPIWEMSEYANEIFRPKKNGRIYNPLLKEFLKKRSIDNWLKTFKDSPSQKRFIEEVKAGGGILTEQDLINYQVIERKPLSIHYHDHEIVTNPPPAFGGAILCSALNMLKKEYVGSLSGREKSILRMKVLKQINHMKASGGTTHMNVIDENNNAVCISSSLGIGSGYFFPDTGIWMNNMMGEEDLHPDNFYTQKAGCRVPSMMAPTFIKKDGQVFASLGSGGSMRIRSAMLQVVLNLIDEKMSVKEAVEAPRMHFDERDILQIEPGFSKDVLDMVLKAGTNHQIWKSKDLYFGGVHTALGTLEGWGDSRRGGDCKSLTG